jgi:predicted  nucleic acid-binding Zn-ribbon protein
MLQSRALLEWHLKKIEWQNIREKLDNIQVKEEELKGKLLEIKKKLENLGEPDEQDIDGKIAFALASQELWMAEKEWERFQDERFNNEMLYREQEEICRQELDELKGRISRETMQTYEEVSEFCDNPVVEVKRRSCMGCFLPLSIPTMNAWRKGKKLVRCEVCGRILV